MAGEVGKSEANAVRGVEEAAVRMLGHREHGCAELARKLIGKGHAKLIVEQVVSKLERLELVSDARFVESFVRSRLQRGQGPLRIRAELRERGVQDHLVDDVLTETAEFWRSRAEQARRKRFGSPVPDDRTVWNRQARFLSQRGFPGDVIYRVLAELNS